MPELTEFLNTLTESRILLFVGAFLLAIFGYAVVKRLLKVALFVIVFIVAYTGLVYYFG